MNWKVVVRPEAEQDVVDAGAWYEARQPGLGAEFVQEVIQVWDALAENPLLNSRRHPQKIFAGATRNVFHIALFMKLSKQIKRSSWRQSYMRPVMIAFGSAG